MDFTQKNISEMLVVVQGDITEQSMLTCRRIDTIVNAAKPTLMGSDQGVDGSIHKKINEYLLPKNCTYADKICEDLHTGTEKRQIRCERGKAVVTSGYNLCKKIIHVVGIPFDGRKGGCEWVVSSSRVRILEACYEEIVKQIKEYPEINVIAIPIIGAGEYGFPFKLAVRIAIATVGNALVDWKKSDHELFEMAGIKKVFFYVYDKNDNVGRQYFLYADKVLKQYVKLFAKDKKVVFQCSLMAHVQYFNEVYRYDKARGYFSVAKMLRLLLLLIRIPLFLMMLLKDICGGKNWERRRASIELLAFLKMLLPLLFYYLYNRGMRTSLFSFFCIYNLCDTITYLLALIIFADIQKPSANIIRSLIMLFVNYLEVSLDLAFLYFAAYGGAIAVQDALAFGILGRAARVVVKNIRDYSFLYVNAGCKFFFASFTFGYLANHMKQRKFRS